MIRKGNLNPSYLVSLLFLLFLIIIVLLNFGNIPTSKTLLFQYGSWFIFTTVLGLTSFKKSTYPMLDFIQKFFPLLLMGFIFDSLANVIQFVTTKDIDDILIKADLYLFGVLPAVALERISFPLLTDILHLAYISYYFIPFGFLLYLYYAKNDMEAFHLTFFIIMFTYYLSFLGYFLFPAVGPWVTLLKYQSHPLQGLFITDPIREAIAILEGIKRDAFPSGHTAIMLVVLYFVYKYKLKIRASLPISVDVIALLFSTVYDRYHYVVDVLGGILLAIITISLGPGIYRKWRKWFVNYNLFS